MIYHFGYRDSVEKEKQREDQNIPTTDSTESVDKVESPQRARHLEEDDIPFYASKVPDLDEPTLSGEISEGQPTVIKIDL